MKKILAFSLILITIIVFAQPVQAITDSSTASRITSNTTWSNTSVPYEYSGGVEVAEGATLIITPGVKVQNTTFYLYGNLSIQGTSSSPTILDRVRLKGPQTGLCPCPRVNITYATIENSPDFMWYQFGNSSISNSYFLNLENAGGSAYSYIWYPNGNISFTSNVFVNKSFSIGHSNNIQVTFTGNTFYGKSSVQNWAAYQTSMTSLSNNYFQTPFEGILSLPSGYTHTKMSATSNYWEGASGDIEKVKSWILDRNDSSGRASTIALTPLLSSIPVSAPSYVSPTTTTTTTTTTVPFTTTVPSTTTTSTTVAPTTITTVVPATTTTASSPATTTTNSTTITTVSPTATTANTYSNKTPSVSPKPLKSKSSQWSDLFWTLQIEKAKLELKKFRSKVQFKKPKKYTTISVPFTSKVNSNIRTGAICRSGKISTATQNGACSSNGGVAKWLTLPSQKITVNKKFSCLININTNKHEYPKNCKLL
jgi:hypothetical protein